MEEKYYQLLISAEDKAQAEAMLDDLLQRKLILGGPILEGPAKFWWKGEIVEMNYAYILTYTKERLKQAIIDRCNQISKEEIPMLSFIPFEGNPELIRLIDDTLG